MEVCQKPEYDLCFSNSVIVRFSSRIDVRFPKAECATCIYKSTRFENRAYVTQVSL